MSAIADRRNLSPGPAVGPVNLVLGHPNFAHHAWNQLSALEEMVRSDLPDGIQMVTTHQPFGPIQKINPRAVAVDPCLHSSAAASSPSHKCRQAFFYSLANSTVFFEPGSRTKTIDTKLHSLPIFHASNLPSFHSARR